MEHDFPIYHTADLAVGRMAFNIPQTQPLGASTFGDQSAS